MQNDDLTKKAGSTCFACGEVISKIADVSIILLWWTTFGSHTI